MARIILADDDEIIADIVRNALMAAGHAVGWFDNGRDALSLMEQRPPDLAILDCNMPELSGVLLLRKMRLSLRLCEVPVLMFTGRTAENDEAIARYEGANDYITKPFDPTMLVSRAEALLAKAKPGTSAPSW